MTVNDEIVQIPQRGQFVKKMPHPMYYNITIKDSNNSG